MDSLHIKLQQANKKFKTNALTSSIINMLMLGLVLVFFSIGFNLTQKIIIDFVNLSWSSILPNIVDLATIAGLIFILKKFLNVLNKPDLFIYVNEEDKEEEQLKKIEFFLKNSYLNGFNSYIGSLIGLSIIYFFLSISLEGINNQFSSINEWYFTSSYFVSLPIFPINLILIIVIVGVVLPLSINYARYINEITEMFNVKDKDIKIQTITQLSSLHFCRNVVFIGLIIFCVAMSLMQKNNVWIFKYKNPIAEENVLSEKIGYNWCRNTYSYTTLHNTNVFVDSVVEKDDFSRQERTNQYFYPITSELKNKLQESKKSCIQ